MMLEGIQHTEQRGRQFDLIAPTYGAIYADPAWRFETRSFRGRSRSPDDDRRMIDGQGYHTMPTPAICALPVAMHAAKHCALFLWAIGSMMPDALAVIDAWGFTYKTFRVWAKTREAGFAPELTLEQNFPMGTGYIVRGNAELLLIATKGAPRFRCKSIRSIIFAPRREHSRKPDQARTDIERMVVGPYLELNARTVPPGWDAWGDQLETFQPEQAA